MKCRYNVYIIVYYNNYTVYNITYNFTNIEFCQQSIYEPIEFEGADLDAPV